MPNPFDPNQFTLDPASMSSFQDRIAELRKGLPPSVQAMQPAIPGQPTGAPPVPQALQAVQQAPEAKPSQLQAPRQQRMGLDEAAKAVQQPSVGAQGDPTIQQLKDTISKINPKILAQLEKEAMNLEPAKLIGPDVFGRGGIMGTGVEPIDVLAFALGIGATWNLPQDKAQANTFAIASWPSKYKESQREASKAYIQNAIGGLNAASAGSNALNAQTKALNEQEERTQREALAQAYDAVGRHADATALRAGSGGVAAHIALTGKEAANASGLPPRFYEMLDGISSGVVPLDQVPQQVLTMLGNPRTAEEAQTMATAWLQTNLSRQAPIPTQTGGAVVRGVGGPLAAEDAPGMKQIQDMVRRARGQAPLAPIQQPNRQPLPPMEMPTAPGVTPNQPLTPSGVPLTGGPMHVPPNAQTPGQLGAPAQVGTEALINRAANSPNKYDRWTAQYATSGDLPPESVAKSKLLFQRPMDAGDRQKLVAQSAAIEYAKELETDYNTMVNAYGGPQKFKFLDQFRQYLMGLGTRVGEAGLMTTTAVDLARAWAQRYGKPFPPEAAQFLATYAQAQKFAKGAMNDAANLANKERQMFNNMIGQPMDTPAIFNATIQSFYRNISKEYNSLLKSNNLKATDGFEPLAIPAARSTAATGPRVITDPNELNQWRDIQTQTKPGEQY